MADAELTVGADIGPLDRKLDEATARLLAFKAESDRILGGSGGGGSGASPASSVVRDLSSMGSAPPNGSRQLGGTPNGGAPLWAAQAARLEPSASQRSMAGALGMTPGELDRAVNPPMGVVPDHMKIIGMRDNAAFRAEAVRLAGRGWSPTQIAEHQGRTLDQVGADLTEANAARFLTLGGGAGRGGVATAMGDLAGGGGGGGFQRAATTAASSGGGGGGAGALPLIGVGLGLTSALGPSVAGVALGGIGAAALAGASAGGFLLTAMPALSQVTTAISNNVKLKGPMAPLEAAVKGFGAQWQQLSLNSGGIGVLLFGIREMERVLPRLEPIFKASSVAMTDFGKVLFSYILNPNFTAFTQWMATAMPPAMTSLGQVMGNVGAGMSSLIEASSPLITMFEQGAVALSGAFMTWTSHLGASSGFQGFLKTAQAEVPLVGNLLGQLGVDIGLFYGVIAPAGPWILTAFGNLARGLGPDLVTLKNDLAPIWPLLGPILDKIAKDLPKVLNAILKALGPLINEIARALGDLSHLHPFGKNGPSALDLVPTAITGALTAYGLNRLPGKPVSRLFGMLKGNFGTAADRGVPAVGDAVGAGLGDAAGGALGRLAGFATGPIGALAMVALQETLLAPVAKDAPGFTAFRTAINRVGTILQKAGHENWRQVGSLTAPVEGLLTRYTMHPSGLLASAMVRDLRNLLGSHLTPAEATSYFSHVATQRKLATYDRNLGAGIPQLSRTGLSGMLSHPGGMGQLASIIIHSSPSLTLNIQGATPADLLQNITAVLRKELPALTKRQEEQLAHRLIAARSGAR